MKYFAIGKEERKTYGHGDFGKEIHICPKNAYMGDMSFHPIFETKEEAEKYIKCLKWGHTLRPVELFVNATKPIRNEI